MTILLSWGDRHDPQRLSVAGKTCAKFSQGTNQKCYRVLANKEIKKMLQRLKKNGSKFSMRKLSNNEEKVYEANISLFNALQFTDSDLKGKFSLKRFIAAHCIILAIEGVPAFYFNSLFATKNDEETFASTGVKRNLNRYKWHYSTLVNLIKTNNTIEKNCYELFL